MVKMDEKYHFSDVSTHGTALEDLLIASAESETAAPDGAPENLRTLPSMSASSKNFRRPLRRIR
jgi:hypothetical protein